jgi:hypothetical protein
MKMRIAIFGLALWALAACPPAPISPGNDASDSAPPVSPPLPPVSDSSPPISFEQGVCNALAASGCQAASAPGCAASIAANKIPGGFATPWAACLYGGANPSTCKVPCK